MHVWTRSQKSKLVSRLEESMRKMKIEKKKDKGEILREGITSSVSEGSTRSFVLENPNIRIQHERNSNPF